VRTNGRVACWGDNKYGKATPPTGVFASVTAGDEYTCALNRDRVLYCWGKVWTAP
jgi:alpha-tubulin suppressor-like RCC1 family protein